MYQYHQLLGKQISTTLFQSSSSTSYTPATSAGCNFKVHDDDCGVGDWTAEGWKSTGRKRNGPTCNNGDHYSNDYDNAVFDSYIPQSLDIAALDKEYCNIAHDDAAVTNKDSNPKGKPFDFKQFIKKKKTESSIDGYHQTSNSLASTQHKYLYDNILENVNPLTDLYNVSIDSFLEQVLKFKLGCEDDSACTVLEEVPIRFLDNEHYMRIFQPILIEELRASLKSYLVTGWSYETIKERAGHFFPKQDMQSSKLQVSTVLVKPIECVRKTSNIVEVKVTRMSNSTNSTNPSANLQKEDLVIIMKKKGCDLQSVKSAISSPHCLAYVSSVSHFHDNKDRADTSYNLIVLSDEVPPLSSPRLCVKVTSISTFIREFVSISSIHLYRLTPIIPYLLKASPAISTAALDDINNKIESSLKSFSSMMSSSSERGRKLAILETLHVALRELDCILIDCSVLKNTKIVKTLQMIQSQLLPSDLKASATAIISKWKAQIKNDHSKSTIRSFVGGNVINIQSSDAPCPSISSHLWHAMCSANNPSQLFAIKYICNDSRDKHQYDCRVVLLQGPPGTGKTATICGILSGLLNKINVITNKLDRQKFGIILAAPSNAAIDELIVKIARGILMDTGTSAKVQNIRIVRIGTSSGCGEIQQFMLDYQVESILQKDALHRDLKSINNRYYDLQGQLLTYDTDRSTSDNGNELRKQLVANIKYHKDIKAVMERKLEALRVQVRHDVLNNADIVVGTCSAFGQKNFVSYVVNAKYTYDYCIIDEAAQCTEPSALIPLKFGCKNLVLVGDPRQLPSTTLSVSASKAGLSMSLFERLEKCGHEKIMLMVQYRMHPAIRMFPSKQFYENLLVDADMIQLEVQAVKSAYEADTSLSANYGNVTAPFTTDGTFYPVTFFNSNSREEKSNKSYINRGDSQFICNFLLDNYKRFSGLSIAIISLYKAQCSLIKEYLSQHTSIHSIEVNTVDGYQGRESDIVIVSTVRSGQSIGFVSNENRMNVALTRAKKLLVLVGNTNALRNDPTWYSFIKSLEGRKCIIEACKLEEAKY